MLTLLSINWNPNPELFNLFGSLPIRYYGLLWVVGIALAYVIVHRQYHDRKIDEKTFEPLFFYCFFGILVGALSVLPAGLLPESLLGTDTSREVPAGRRLEVYRLRRACQSRRYAGTDYRPLDVLPQNQDALYGCAGHDSRSHTCHRLLHPPCQPDELRDYRQAGRCALGFRL